MSNQQDDFLAALRFGFEYHSDILGKLHSRSPTAAHLFGPLLRDSIITSLMNRLLQVDELLGHGGFRFRTNKAAAVELNAMIQNEFLEISLSVARTCLSTDPTEYRAQAKNRIHAHLAILAPKLEQFILTKLKSVSDENAEY